MKTILPQNSQNEEQNNNVNNVNVIKDSMADVDINTILSLIKGQDSTFDKLIQWYIVKDMMESSKKRDNGSLFDRMLEVYLVMEFFDRLKNKNVDIEKFIQLLQLKENKNNNELSFRDILMMLNNMHDKYSNLILNIASKKEEEKKELEDRITQLEEFVKELVDRWGREKVEMFAKFEETLRKMYEERRPFEEIRRFIQEYEEFKKCIEQFQALLEKEKVVSQPLIEQEGGKTKINWEKVILYVLDKLGGIVGRAMGEKPEKKEVKMPKVENIAKNEGQAVKTESQNIEVIENVPSPSEQSS